MERAEKGTIHTKRHAQEESHKEENKKELTLSGSIKSAAGSMASSAGSAMVAGIQRVGEKVRALSGSTGITKQEVTSALSIPSADEHTIRPGIDRQMSASSTSTQIQSQTQPEPKSSTQNREGGAQDSKQPRPLPMPEYGGWFAPLTEFLPDASQPISNFHRCNLAAILLTDLVVDGLDLDCHSVDWSVHIPLMLHIIFLGLDNSRELIYRHCHQLLLNLLIVLGQHNDHLTVSSVLMNGQIDQMKFGLSLPTLPILEHDFTQQCDTFDVCSNHSEDINEMETSGGTISEDDESGTSSAAAAAATARPAITKTDAEGTQKILGPDADVSELTKALIHFIASRRCQQMWPYEDITRTMWTIHSASQIDNFLQYVVQVFEHSLPHAHLSERWSQLALQLALSCSSRHYAGRSLQIFRALRVPISFRMLSDILSRLVETIAEQGEDMQGYVSELILTLEAVVEALDSDIRPIDRNKEIFKSTPNLKDSLSPKNNKGNDSDSKTVEDDSGTTFGVETLPASVAVSPVGGHSYHSSAPPTSGYGNKSSRQKSTSPIGDMRGRSSTESEGKRHHDKQVNLSRSRSAQSLKVQDQTAQDDKMNVLVQLFWICLAVLESDFEHEFLLGLRLLERVLRKLPLDRPDVREKVEKMQGQLKWNNFPGAHSLLLKGCTNPNTYDATIQTLSKFTLLLDFTVVDPSQSLAFPMNVIALLPYLVQNYEDANDVCIESAESIAYVSTEKHKKLENLATVMTLYSKGTFSKESLQWTKCVVKYLYDLYSRFSFNMLGFLVEVLEKGPAGVQAPVLTIIYCLLHYVDMQTATQTINSDLLRTVAKFVETQHWKEALKILKLAVTRSSTLVAPSSSGGVVSYHYETSSGANFAEPDLYFKKELPGRTMEFTFDLSQTPVIARRQKPSGGAASVSGTMTGSTYSHYSSHLSSLISSTHSTSSSAYGSYSIGSASTLTSAMAKASVGGDSVSDIASLAERESIRTLTERSSVREEFGPSNSLSPKRSLSLTAADSTSYSGWKRPLMSQSRVRERLVNLLNTCGQRVGLPKSPSVSLKRFFLFSLFFTCNDLNFLRKLLPFPGN